MKINRNKSESQGPATGPGPGGWSKGSNVKAPPGARGAEIKNHTVGPGLSGVKPAYESSDMRPGSKGK
jgi:hypothetical protein